MAATEKGSRAPRNALHQLVDRIPETETHAAQRFLEFLAARADYDEEPLTPQEEAALEQGRRAIRQGDVRPLDEVLPAPERPRSG